MSHTRTAFVGLSLGLLLGCSGKDDAENPGSGATSVTSGTDSTATTGTTGTNASSSTGSVGTSSTSGVGGMSTSGMGGMSTSGVGGMSTSGMGGMSASGMGGMSTSGAGGMSTSGMGGAGGNGGTSGVDGSGGGSTAAATPSAGCGKGSQGTKISKNNEEIVDFPSSYDGDTPFPLLMMLHACGNPNDQWESLTNSRGPQGLVDEYIRWMPNTTAASGQCWSNYNNDVARILDQYDELLDNYCIDTSRIFGVGHSSGAQMLVNILSHQSDAQHLDLRGVAPVAADPYNVVDPIPVLYIDGENDNQRSPDSATNAVARFRTSNMCSDTSVPYSEIMGCNSHQNQQAVDPGCIIYDDCSVPTIWCSHNDPDYSNTEHGVPCFATQAIYDFFKMLAP